MEKDFQTSFIPKQNVIAARPAATHGFGILTLISVLVVITVMVAYGGIFFYKGITSRSILGMKSELEQAKNSFEPARITELDILDRRLQSAKEVLSSHIATSPIFAEVGKITMKTVRFKSFDYSLVDDGGMKVMVKMGGQGVGYRSVALQSDLFSSNKYFIDPVFSSLALDPKGNVDFELEFMVEPTFVDYQEMLKVTEN